MKSDGWMVSFHSWFIVTHILIFVLSLAWNLIGAAARLTGPMGLQTKRGYYPSSSGNGNLIHFLHPRQCVFSYCLFFSPFKPNAIHQWFLAKDEIDFFERQYLFTFLCAFDIFASSITTWPTAIDIRHVVRTFFSLCVFHWLNVKRSLTSKRRLARSQR